MFKILRDDRERAMNYNDFIIAYAILTKPKPEEIAQICFYVFRIQPSDDDSKEYVLGQWMIDVGIKIIQLTEDEIIQFLKENQIKKDQRLYYADFEKICKGNMNHPLFSWFSNFSDSSKGLENADISLLENRGQKFKTPTKRLTSKTIYEEISMMDSLQVVQDFTRDERQALDIFFDLLIKQPGIKESTKILDDLFGGFEVPDKLKHRIIEGFLYSSESRYFDNKIFMKIMYLLTKESERDRKIDYIFDIFSKYNDRKMINSQQIQEVINIFAIDPWFTKFKYLINFQLGVRPIDEKEEKEVIRNLLENQQDLNVYVQQKITEREYFYMMNKQFWKQWRKYVGYNKMKNQKAARPSGINNNNLKEDQNSHKLRDLVFDKDYILVTPYMWKALVSWYGETYEIKRYVIKYPNNEDSKMQRKNNELKEYKLLSVKKDQFIYEIEVNEIYVKYEKILEDGKRPTANLKEAYFSRTKKFIDILFDLQDKLKVSNRGQTRLWIDNNLVLEEMLDQTLESANIKNGQKFFIEEMMENQRYPTDDKILKQVISNSRVYKKSKGCFNLGNTCYMNSVLQCLSNSPYMKEFFCGIVINSEGKILDDRKSSGDNKKHGDYFKIIEPAMFLQQINTKNQMGQQGAIAKAFSVIVSEMWTNKFACYPSKFKSTLGKNFEQFRNSQQQDAQEFLVTLLDSLHEEINIRLRKQFIENPSSDDRQELQLQYEYQANFLARNWSFMVFLFYGQLRSYLKCTSCQRERISYEPFSTVSLPLPEVQQITLTIVLSLLPQDIKSILENTKFEIEKSQLHNLELARRQSLNFDIFEQIYLNQTKERPFKVLLKIDTSARVRDIYERLKQFSGIDLQEVELESSTLVYFFHQEGRKRQINTLFDPNFKLLDYKIKENDIIMLKEILTKKGKDQIQKFYAKNAEYFYDSKKALMVLRQWDDYKPVGASKHDLELDQFQSHRASDFDKNSEPDLNEEMISDGGINSDFEEKGDGKDSLSEGEEILRSPSHRMNKENCKIQTTLHLLAALPLVDDDGNEVKDDNGENEQSMFGHLVQETQNTGPQTTNETQVNNDVTLDKLNLAMVIEQTSIQENKVQNQNFESRQSAVQRQKTQRAENTSFIDFYNQYQTTEKKPQKPLNLTEYIITSYNRKLAKSTHYVINPIMPHLFGFPIMILANKNTTGREIYEEIWMRVRFQLKLSNQSMHQNRDILWWAKTDSKYQKYTNTQSFAQASLENEESIDESPLFSPFIIKLVKKSGMQCSKCSWKYKCLGCILIPSTSEVIFEQMKDGNSYLAIDWDNQFIEQHYIEHAWRPTEHASVKDFEQVFGITPKIKELSDCIKSFSAQEIIQANELRCDKCKYFTVHEKKMDFSSLPPILILHFKRFKMTSNGKSKIKSFVNYPLYDLDMREYLALPESYQNLSKESTTYDLFGVINHIGSGMNQGHYISFIKNEHNNNWYQYDDSSCKDLLESQVRSENAYILFYKRQDLMPTSSPTSSFQQNSQKTIRDIYPEINHCKFRGKPINTVFGAGFIWKYEQQIMSEFDSHYHIRLRNNIDLFVNDEAVILDELDNEDVASAIEKQEQLDREQSEKNSNGSTTNGQVSVGNGNPIKRDRSKGSNGVCSIY